jgi:hypothetical protein
LSVINGQLLTRGAGFVGPHRATKRGDYHPLADNSLLLKKIPAATARDFNDELKLYDAEPKRRAV